jgi:SAM-dependent methyltransferase
LESPPVELIFRVVGTDDADAFVQSGDMHVDVFGELLRRHGRDWGDFHDIYDFGCGCGRLTRALRERAPQARMTATDIDEPAVEWLREHMPEADVRKNEWLPPLPFEDGAFDLVIAFSVFTHLPEDFQDAWLAELHRVTRPGALLLLTVHGESHWRQTWEVNFAQAPRRLRLQSKLFAVKRRLKGFVHWRGDGWERLFPDYYHTTWHTPSYIRRHWSKWFEVLDVHENERPNEQDTVVLRRA